MRARQPLPRIWLMTDERLPDLEATVAALPRGSGIVFRHRSLKAKMRRALFDRVLRVARARRHLLLLADSPSVARQWGADGAHNRSRLRSWGLRTCAVHCARERIAAQRAGANLIFVSPVHATRSHPEQKPLGIRRARQIAAKDWQRAILLGGMTAARFKRLPVPRAHGWAAIDAFIPPQDQNLKAVPI